ncbi:DnaJ domain-containing protein [Acuticoccus sp. I52.16.1]|uniref:DnaJ domain-containing protein n=1 Tax=Acuticoccus sp. I52.16.1 TaxID=2928472 RepID=UPI001FD52DE4|nr:DnaJ domain-containing protein [Acuticoccus sp. I52.16.1]UOM36124.1 DnaJ domain-containing protein [Acuticoccus sp. I52.16.1]
MILLLLPLLVGLLLFAAMVVAARWFAGANTAALAQKVRHGGNAGLILVGLFLLLRGRPTLGISLIGAGLGRLSRQGAFTGGPFGANPFGGAGPFAGGQRSRRSSGTGSTVRTASLEATLDHDSGDMDATVLAGRFQGRAFSGMLPPELTELWRGFAAAGEEDSKLLVEAYLDRRHPGWRDGVEADGDARSQGSRRAGRTNGGPMSEDEAYEVLGLLPGASEGQIRAAHRRLMKQMHPDHGGSAFLAAQLNEARDVLLGRS